MTTEQTPLLASEAAESDHNLIYSRFSPRRKRTIVALIAWARFIPCTTFFFFAFGSWVFNVHMAPTDRAMTRFFTYCNPKSLPRPRSFLLFLKSRESLVQMFRSSGTRLPCFFVPPTEENSRTTVGQLA